MLAWLNVHHHLIISQNSRDGENTTAKRLAEGDNIGLDAVVVAGKKATRPTDSGLHLIRD